MPVRDGIGGYLGLEPYAGKPYHNMIALDNARSYQKYVNHPRGIRAMWLPDCLRPAVRKADGDAGWSCGHMLSMRTCCPFTTLR
jgi:hypothetical protein